MGRFTYCGSVLVDWKARSARYTPLARPEADAVMFSTAGPVPESGETVSQLVLRLAGSIARLQACPNGTLTFTWALADPEELRALRDSPSVDKDSAPDEPLGPWNSVEPVATTWFPVLSTASIS